MARQGVLVAFPNNQGDFHFTEKCSEKSSFRLRMTVFLLTASSPCSEQCVLPQQAAVTGLA